MTERAPPRLSLAWSGPGRKKYTTAQFWHFVDLAARGQPNTGPKAPTSVVGKVVQEAILRQVEQHIANGYLDPRMGEQFSGYLRQLIETINSGAPQQRSTR